MSYATKTKKLEVLALRRYRGAYDFPACDRLIRCGNGNHFAVIDQWCGSKLEGECYRAPLFPVATGDVQAILDHFAIAETEHTFHEATNIPVDLLGESIGRAAIYKWADAIFA